MSLQSIRCFPQPPSHSTPQVGTSKRASPSLYGAHKFPRLSSKSSQCSVTRLFAMDHNRSNPGPIGRNKPGDQAEPQYHRAYKGGDYTQPPHLLETDSWSACISCRKKKAKCRITAEEYAAGLPCAKCRREMCPCTYTVTRHGSRRQSQSVSQSQNGDEDRMEPGMHASSASDVHTSPATAAQHDDPHEIA